MTSQALNRPVDALRVLDELRSFSREWASNDLALELDQARAAVAELIEAAGRVLIHRVGDLPNLGYIRDNDQSRKDIAAFVAAIAAVDGKA